MFSEKKQKSGKPKNLKKPKKYTSLKARLQPFTVLFSFSAILVCFIDAQFHSYFHENIKQTKIALKEKSTVNGCKRALI